MKCIPARKLACLYNATLNKNETEKNKFDYSVTMENDTFLKFKKSKTANRYVARVFDEFAVVYAVKSKG